MLSFLYLCTGTQLIQMDHSRFSTLEKMMKDYTSALVTSLPSQKRNLRFIPPLSE